MKHFVCKIYPSSLENKQILVQGIYFFFFILRFTPFILSGDETSLIIDEKWFDSLPESMKTCLKENYQHSFTLQTNIEVPHEDEFVKSQIIRDM